MAELKFLWPVNTTSNNPNVFEPRCLPKICSCPTKSQTHAQGICTVNKEVISTYNIIIFNKFSGVCMIRAVIWPEICPL